MQCFFPIGLLIVRIFFYELWKSIVLLHLILMSLYDIKWFCPTFSIFWLVWFMTVFTSCRSWECITTTFTLTILTKSFDRHRWFRFCTYVILGKYPYMTSLTPWIRRFLYKSLQAFYKYYRGLTFLKFKSNCPFTYFTPYKHVTYCCNVTFSSWHCYVLVPNQYIYFTTLFSGLCFLVFKY